MKIPMEDIYVSERRKINTNSNLMKNNHFIRDDPYFLPGTK